MTITILFLIFRSSRPLGLVLDNILSKCKIYLNSRAQSFGFQYKKDCYFFDTLRIACRDIGCRLYNVFLIYYMNMIWWWNKNFVAIQNCQIGWKLSNCGQFSQLVLKFGQIRQIERILKAICNALLDLLMCFLLLLITKANAVDLYSLLKLTKNWMKIKI